MLAIRSLFVGISTRLASDRPRPHLVRNVIALAAGSALLAGTAARAQDAKTFPTLLLATGGVYGGTSQNHDVCYVFNAGTSSAKVLIVLREQKGGFTGPPTTTVMAPGTISAAAAFVKHNVAYSCTVKGPAGSSATDLRGVMDVRDVNNNVLINSDLR
jgi:hypothetical protein